MDKTRLKEVFQAVECIGKAFGDFPGKLDAETAGKLRIHRLHHCHDACLSLRRECADFFGDTALVGRCRPFAERIRFPHFRRNFDGNTAICRIRLLKREKIISHFLGRVFDKEVRRVFVAVLVEKALLVRVERADELREIVVACLLREVGIENPVRYLIERFAFEYAGLQFFVNLCVIAHREALGV